MMSASAMSKAIRDKKKKMEETESGAVKLSGIPQDATDAEVIKGHEPGEALSENIPKDRDESPSLESLTAQEMAPQPHDEKWEDPKQINQPEDGPIEDRKAKMKKMLGRMGK